MMTKTYVGLLDFAKDIPTYINHYYGRVYMTPEAKDILEGAAEHLVKMLKPGATIQVLAHSAIPPDMVIFAPSNGEWTPENVRVVKIIGLAPPEHGTE
jgi:hypothetical protein